MASNKASCRDWACCQVGARDAVAFSEKMMRVCASAMRLIARALERNVVKSDPADRLVTAFELAADFAGVFGGFGGRRVMFNSQHCVSSG